MALKKRASGEGHDTRSWRVATFISLCQRVCVPKLSAKRTGGAEGSWEVQISSLFLILFKIKFWTSWYTIIWSYDLWKLSFY